MIDQTAMPHPQERMKLADILAIMKVSKSHWYAGVQSGKYPKPVVRTGRMTRWLRADIDRLLAPSVDMQSGTATLQLAPPVEAEQAKGAEAVPVLERSAPNTRSLVAKGLFGLDPARSRAVAIFMIDWAFANTRKHKEYPDGRIESRLARDRLLMAAGGPIPAYVERVLIPFMRKSA